MATTFDDLMASIDKAGKDVQRDRGNMFEDVVKSYLTKSGCYVKSQRNTKFPKKTWG